MIEVEPQFALVFFLSFKLRSCRLRALPPRSPAKRSQPFGIPFRFSLFQKWLLLSLDAALNLSFGFFFVKITRIKGWDSVILFEGHIKLIWPRTKALKIALNYLRFKNKNPKLRFLRMGPAPFLRDKQGSLPDRASAPQP